MNCEICGKSLKSLSRIKLEGAVMQVCEKCSGLGQKIETPKSVDRILGNKVVFVPKRREFEISKESVVENYAALVKAARERRGLTQEQLARNILEKDFIIHRIEQARMQPTIEIARKLQRALGIQLITMAAEEKADAYTVDGQSGATIADFIKVKKK